MNLVPITIEEILLLGISRFYILEDTHFISIESQGGNLLIWDTYKQEWRPFFTTSTRPFNKVKEYINDNNYPIFIKSNKETNDTNSK